MAVAEKTSPHASQQAETTWYGIIQQVLKRNEISLVPYVPDRVLTTLIRNLHADPFFTTFPTAREEEAVGIVSGAWMGGMKGAVLMQTSGFATLANVLASLVAPSQNPADHVRVRARHAWRIQSRPVAGVPHDAAGAGCTRDRTSHLHAARRARIHRRPLDQTGRHHAGAGGAYPQPAAHWR